MKLSKEFLNRKTSVSISITLDDQLFCHENNINLTELCKSEIKKLRVSIENGKYR
ncbi:MAG: hypothetical protein ABIG69_11850 [Bacteroidota bacterium]